MRHLIAVTLLAGCATTVVMDDPCACVIIPVANGGLSLALGGSAATFSDDSAMDDPAIQQITGVIWTTDQFGDSNSIALGATMNGVSIQAVWNDGATFDMTAPAPITEMSVGTSGFAGVTFDTDEDYELGPQGGTVRLREIVAQGEGWRIRGSYAAQVCKTEPEPGPCVSATGTFAFDAGSLPAAGNAQALIPGG